MAESQATLLTIGHSTRTLEELIALLQAHGVTHLVDVRAIPRSRRHPQFNRETLPLALADAGIGYTHLTALGGRRRPRPDSPNSGWRNPSFRGYADHMQTPQFAAALAQLIHLARQERCAIMCAEAVPWRCHRWLIADALTARGCRVEHVLSLQQRRPHTLTPWAQVRGATISYAAPLLSNADDPTSPSD